MGHTGEVAVVLVTVRTVITDNRHTVVVAESDMGHTVTADSRCTVGAVELDMVDIAMGKDKHRGLVKGYNQIQIDILLTLVEVHDQIPPSLIRHPKGFLDLRSLR